MLNSPPPPHPPKLPNYLNHGFPALDRFFKISEQTDYPFAKLLRTEVFELFKIDAEASDLIKVEKLLDALDISLSEAMTARTLFGGLKKEED